MYELWVFGERLMVQNLGFLFEKAYGSFVTNIFDVCDGMRLSLRMEFNLKYDKGIWWMPWH